MSADASAGEPEQRATSAEYDRMLETLDDAIEEAHEKIVSGRVYSPENERVRCQWIRTLAYTMNVRRQVAADRDLEELGERVEQLEEAQGVGR